MHDDPTTGTPSLVTTQPGDPAAIASSDIGRRVLFGEDRSPNAWVCPFLRAIDDGDALGLPLESPDSVNRCASMQEAIPQSVRQQELVCLTDEHINCPRYLRGSRGGTGMLDRVRLTQGVTRATAAALTLFLLAFAVSLAFVVSNGGLVLTSAAPTPGGSILPVPSVTPTEVPATPAATALATATATDRR